MWGIITSVWNSKMILKGPQERKKKVNNGKWHVITDEFPGEVHGFSLQTFCITDGDLKLFKMKKFPTI